MSVFLLDLLDFGRTFSTAPVAFATTEPVLAVLREGGLQTLSWTLDEQTDTGRIGGLTARLLNQDTLIQTLTGIPLENSRVRLRHGFDTLAEGEFLTLLTGVVDRYSVTWDGIELSILQPDIKERVPLSVPLDGSVFPDLPPASRGMEVPLILGTVAGVPLPLVNAGTWTYVAGLAPVGVSDVRVAGTSVAYSTNSVSVYGRPVLTVTLSSSPPEGSPVVADLTGASGGNPVDVLTYLLNTYVPTAAYDAASFAAVRSQLSGWAFAAALTSPGDTLTLLPRLTRQCRTLLYRGNQGEYRLALLHPATAAVATFDASNLVERSVTRESGPVDTIYSSFTVYYQGHGVSNAATDFQASAYATPTASNFTGSTDLVALCAAAKAAYGTDHRLDVFAEWIQDSHTANLLLNYLVHRYSANHDLMGFESWLDAAPITLGQRLTLTHPLVPGGGPATAQVVGVEFAPATLHAGLQARLHDPIEDDA